MQRFFFLVVAFYSITLLGGCSAVPPAGSTRSPGRIDKRDNVTYSAYEHWYRSAETVDVAAEPVGGISAFMANLNYPRDLRRRRIQGKVRVQVSLNATGAVKTARVVQSGGSDFDAIVLRAVREARWKPAMRAGKPVPFTFTFPVTFIPHA